MVQLNFFDCNTYIGRQRKSSPLAFHTVEGLLAEMDYLGIDEAVVYHVASNGRLMEDIEGHKQLHGCWVYPLHHYPSMPEPIKMVEDMLNQGVKITREAYRTPVLLTDSDLGKFPDETRPSYSAQNIYDICQRYPRTPLVIMRLNFSAINVIYPLMK